MLERAGRPLPTFSEDEVVDYFVAEAVVLKAAAQEAEEQKQREREEWRKGHRALGKSPGMMS